MASEKELLISEKLDGYKLGGSFQVMNVLPVECLQLHFADFLD